MLFVVIEFIIVHAGELLYIILPQSPFYKPLLPGISNGVHRFHYDVGYDRGKEAIFGVVDGDGAGTLNCGGVVLGEDVKESEVKLSRWELAQGKGDDKGVDDGARLNAKIAVQGEGHAIGAA